MAAKKTHIVLVLDNSGSMETTKIETMQGFNTFISEQAEVEGKCKVSLIMFNTRPHQIYNDVDLADIKPLTKDTYSCDGMTALHDAMGLGITTLAEKISSKKTKPLVIFVTMTDGGENASSKYNASAIRALVEKYKAEDWQFVFLGANQDAAISGTALGIDAANTLTFASNSDGTKSAYQSVLDNSRSYRTGMTKNMSFTSADVTAQLKAGA